MISQFRRLGVEVSEMTPGNGSRGHRFVLRSRPAALPKIERCAKAALNDV